MTPRAALMVLCAIACGESRPTQPPPRPDAGTRRFVKPPQGDLFAFPPHAIRPDGVGPYLLGAPLTDVLHALPDGPRIELLQLGRYADWRLVRAEDGGILIGADQDNQVGFVAVLRPAVARTEHGIEVGATGAKLVQSFGDPLERRDTAHDRKVYEFASLPGVRFLTDAAVDAPDAQARVVAVLVEKRDARPRPATSPAAGSCRDDNPLADRRLTGEILGVARARERGPAGRDARWAFGCFSGTQPEVVILGQDELVIVGGEPGKLRRVAAVPRPPGTYIVPFDSDGDGRDEVLVGNVVRGATEVSVELRVFAWDTSFHQVLEDRPWVITAPLAAAAGVAPNVVDVAVEVSPAPAGTGQGISVRAAALFIAPQALFPLEPVTLRLARRAGGASSPTTPPPPPAPATPPPRDAGPPPDAQVTK